MFLSVLKCGIYLLFSTYLKFSCLSLKRKLFSQNLELQYKMWDGHVVRLQEKYFSLLINNNSNIHLDVIRGIPKLQNSLSVGEKT